MTQTKHKVPFNRPFVAGSELAYIEQAIANARLAGNGPFNGRCQRWLRERLGSPLALMTHSCTGALEMAALLADVQPGDEVIMPSFTFVSTANAFVLRGATPVFVDIRPDTLNLDEGLVEQAITGRTRVVVPVHYAGVSCEMTAIIDIARRHGLTVVEDAAQGLMASYRGRPLGSMGAAAGISFHETKNVTAGEGGALVVNQPEWVERAEVLWEKGTNRTQFARGEVDRYSWVDVGSSYLMSEICAAFLWAQFEASETVTARRLDIWNQYHSALEPTEAAGRLRRPIVPDGCAHNGHTYYVLAPTPAERDRMLAFLNDAGVNAATHYVPLHSALAGRRFGRLGSGMEVTDSVASRLVRLPLWAGMSGDDVSVVLEAVHAWSSTTV